MQIATIMILIGMRKDDTSESAGLMHDLFAGRRKISMIRGFSIPIGDVIFGAAINEDKTWSAGLPVFEFEDHGIATTSIDNV
jgi:hypothetical protein